MASPVKARLIAAGAAGSILLSANFIGQREGEVRTTYLDAGRVETWCFGHTGPNAKSSYTGEECIDLLLKDTTKFQTGVRKQVGRDMPQSVLAAMTSASYNAGLGAFATSPMLPLLRQGSWKAACEALHAPVKTPYGVALGWRATVAQRPHRGLGNRREAEYQLCVEDLR